MTREEFVQKFVEDGLIKEQVKQFCKPELSDSQMQQARVALEDGKTVEETMELVNFFSK